MSQRPVFVYGTLRPGQGNYRRLLSGCTSREEPAPAPDLALFRRGLPYALPMAGACAVGVLITITPAFYKKVLSDLDRLEGYRTERVERSHYIRQHRKVLTAADDTHSAWVYLAGPGIDPTSMHRVPGDDWLLAH